MLLKVVYDTNVIVSAVLKPDSIPASVVTLALQCHVKLCLSEELLEEYTEVLNRPKFGLQPTAVEDFLRDITQGARFVHPKMRITAALDRGDNHVLECAAAAGADYLVTGNTKHFPRPKFRRTQIVTPAEFAIQLLE
jgi:putative PIN family toxin of toxin-antitoxin system